MIISEGKAKTIVTWLMIYIVSVGLAYLFHPLINGILTILAFIASLLFIVFQCIFYIFLACMGGNGELADIGDIVASISSLQDKRWISAALAFVIVSIALILTSRSKSPATIFYPEVRGQKVRDPRLKYLTPEEFKQEINNYVMVK